MQEVGGSIPPGSTSLRRLRLLRLGKPHRSEGCLAVARRATAGLGKFPIASLDWFCILSSWGVWDTKYVYILESLDHEHFYVGVTDDLRARLAKHNAGEVPHTSKYGPWRIRTYFAFDDAARAVAFERYLKSGSGRAFAKKYF
ncbi:MULTISPECIES: GIY-YIG nuclease family protein [unclassified Bradyrhizobium]|uniref:GIY-YIG nuclease family protein n=1 Tax=Bradyrhizobium TaxID=374 RepID=UPI001B8A56BB|nr:GIY-YIG nuclease family protein [Bradyrhizobium japonicum]